MYILGIGKIHNSTACLLKDGEIVAAVSEERFNRRKNTEVFPIEAVNYCLRYADIKIEDVDLIVHSFQHVISPEGENTKNLSPFIKAIKLRSSLTVFLRELINKASISFPELNRVSRFVYKYFNSSYFVKSLYLEKFKKYVAEKLKTNPLKVVAVDHHTCHAYAPYFGFVSNKEKEVLVLTCDAEGDFLCATVSIAQNNRIKRISETEGGNSLAAFYGAITKYLGMKVNEHEYKVMGLAPYASEYQIKKTYQVFKDLFWIDDDLRFRTKIPSGCFYDYFLKKLKGYRFDGIAAAAQKTIEEITVKWVKKIIRKTDIHRIALGGGLFMNVKMNKILMELPEVSEVYICPTAGDESTIIGAGFWGYEKLCRERNINFNPKIIENLYLGPSFSLEEIEDSIKSNNCREKYKVEFFDDIEKKIAELLVSGKVVARLAGHMEWGARALGNRSILADPSNSNIVRIINDQIKNRDFWMPFAPTILSEKAKDYLINPKKTSAPFMVLAFDTTDLAKKELKAALHPYDYTCRPQILEEKDNPKYYKIIKEFEKLTGIGGVLNTSFNLHGEPIVCSPDDALSVFERSGLEYLVLENYLISKR